MNKRIPYFDFLRGVAIIMVIGNHTLQIEDMNIDTLFNPNILLMQIIKIAVPIFLCISGYLLYSNSVNTITEYQQFLKKHLSRIYIPLLIFSLPFIFAKGLVLRSIVGRLALSLMGAFSVYYFVFLIAQFYILLPIIQRLIKARISGLILCAAISMISIIIVTYIKIICAIDLPLFIYAGSFAVWIFFFALGCWFRAYGCQHQLQKYILLCIASLILTYVESIYLTSNYSEAFGIKPSIFIYFAFGLTVIFSAKAMNAYKNYGTKTLLGSGIEKLGRLSFTIYLGHLYIIQLLKSVNIYSSSYAINWIMVTIISAISALLLEYIIPNKFQRYIGL